MCLLQEKEYKEIDYLEKLWCNIKVKEKEGIVLKRNILIAIVLILFSILPLYSSPLFNEAINGTQTGVKNIAGGYLPISFSVRKTAKLNIFEDEEKATLSFNSGYSLSESEEYASYDDENGHPSFIGYSVNSSNRSFFNPTATLSLSLSQSFDKWNYSITLNSRYSQIEEPLIRSSDEKVFSFSEKKEGKWVNKYSDKDKIYSSPWFYGERTNLTNYITLSGSRTFSVKGLDYMSVALNFEAGPFWLLNNVSNGGITLSDYWRVSASSTQQIVLKNERQSINLRWLTITAQHSDSLSYTGGKISPQNKINSFRLRGVLSDTFSVNFSGPELYDSGTTISASLSYNNSLYFGGFQNERSGKDRGWAYSSNLSSSFNLRLFGFISFYYYTTFYIADGYNGSYSLRSGGEVSASFVL